MTQIRVRNTPPPRLMKTIGATNQTTPEAIGELVANCFDARYKNEKLHIVVDMRQDAIKVIDDGTGMSEPILEKAIRIGEDMSRYMDKGKAAKGYFGMGLKTSCATLGSQYEIFTRSPEDKQEYHVKFDLSDFAERPSGEDAWDVIIDAGPIDKKGPLGVVPHGTAVVIEHLKEKNAPVSAVLNYLSEAFKGHLKTGDSIVIVDSTGTHKATPKDPKLIPGSRIQIDTVCGPDGAYRITGWMGLDTKTHNDGCYGFNIYRNNQLVEKWDKSWFRAHLMTSRIIGEVNMDFLDATFYKQGLQQSDIWTIVKAHMNMYLKDIVKASNSVSKKHNIDNPQMLKQIIGELRKAYNESPVSIDYKGNDSETEGSKTAGSRPGIHDAIKNVIREDSLILRNGEETRVINITYLEKALREGVKAPFDYIFEEGDEDGESSELQVILYLDHPLWQGRKTDDEIIKVLATSDAIYRVLVEELDMSSSEALKIRNEWVWNRATGEEE